MLNDNSIVYYCYYYGLLFLGSPYIFPHTVYAVRAMCSYRLLGRGSEWA